VNEQGKFTAEVTPWAGLFVKDADPLIIKDLKASGKLYKSHLYEHSYPFCWRCHTALLYYARDTWFIRMTALRDKLTATILEAIPHTRLNGPLSHSRLPGNANISFRFVEGESLLLHLDMAGVCASTGSACSSGALEPSHVLMALGLDHALANGAIRFSLGAENTDADIPALMQILTPAVQKLRDLSPLYDDFLKA
jgi:cysteine sulfinate desulfinase/cysteine desulfurase-like protein